MAAASSSRSLKAGLGLGFEYVAANAEKVSGKFYLSASTSATESIKTTVKDLPKAGAFSPAGLWSERAVIASIGGGLGAAASLKFTEELLEMKCTEELREMSRRMLRLALSGWYP